jgi:ABC-type transport system involved in multi-copper enzyme maturation permease subunit
MTTTPLAAAVPQPVPSLPAILTIAAYAVREMGRRRRIISLAMLMLLPLGLLLIVRMVSANLFGPDILLAVLLRDLFIPLLIPVVALAVGTSAIGEPVEDGTLVYYWTRPVRRHALYLGRLLAAQFVGAGLMVLSLAVCFAVLATGGFGAVSWPFVKLYLGGAVVVLLGTAIYTAIFACLGTGLRRPLPLLLFYVFGWELLVSGIPQRIQEWTVSFHLRNLATLPEKPPENAWDLVRDMIEGAMQRPQVPDSRSVVVLIAVLAATIAAGIFLLGRRELDKQGD